MVDKLKFQSSDKVKFGSDDKVKSMLANKVY